MSEASPPAAGAALVANIRGTLATTLKVLDHLENSLVQGGFLQGQDSYRKMADTVIGQSLWLQANDLDAAAAPELAHIAERARSIHALLQPYVEVMVRLGAVAASAAPAEVEATSPPPPADSILDILAANGRPMSITALRAATGCGKDVLAARLDALVKSGDISRRSSGGREMYMRAAGR